jgi:hypothetical protein
MENFFNDATYFFCFRLTAKETGGKQQNERPAKE